MKKIAIVLALMLTTFTMSHAQSDAPDAPTKFPVVSEEGKKSCCPNKKAKDLKCADKDCKVEKCDGTKCETKKNVILRSVIRNKFDGVVLNNSNFTLTSQRR